MEIKNEQSKQADSDMLLAHNNISSEPRSAKYPEVCKIIEKIESRIKSYEKDRNVSFSKEILEHAITETLAKNRELGLNLKPEKILELAAIARRKATDAMPEEYQSAIDKANSIIADINQITKANERRLLEAQLREHGQEWLPKLNEWQANKNNRQSVTIDDINRATDHEVRKNSKNNQ